jgi:hypothetical protein
MKFTFCRECFDSSAAEACAPHTGAIGAGTSVLPQKYKCSNNFIGQLYGRLKILCEKLFKTIMLQFHFHQLWYI